MARYKIPYTGLNDSLKHLRIQIIDSLPYTVKNLPKFSTPEQVFNFCKSKFNYKNDPQGIELFQSVPTLLENGGFGDCDCATIFCICMLLNSGFTNCGIVLVGRNKLNPSHIYAYCIDKDEKQILDLTNKKFNFERYYPFKQSIPFKISKTQLDMFLQLADRNPQGMKRRVRKLSNHEKTQGIFLPSKNVFIPHERFDKLPIKKAKQIMLSEGFEVEQLSEYLSGRAERKAKKAQKQANKQQKFEMKMAKKQAKTEKIQAKSEVKKAKAQKKIAKGEASKVRAEAKRLKAEKGESGQGMKIFNKAGEFVKEIVLKPSEEEEQDITDETETPDTEEQETETTDTDTETEEQELEDSPFSKTDILNSALFAVGFFLEKTKRVA